MINNISQSAFTPTNIKIRTDAGVEQTATIQLTFSTLEDLKIKLQDIFLKAGKQTVDINFKDNEGTTYSVSFEEAQEQESNKPFNAEALSTTITNTGTVLSKDSQGKETEYPLVLRDVMNKYNLTETASKILLKLSPDILTKPEEEQVHDVQAVKKFIGDFYTRVDQLAQKQGIKLTPQLKEKILEEQTDALLKIRTLTSVPDKVLTERIEVHVMSAIDQEINQPGATISISLIESLVAQYYTSEDSHASFADKYAKLYKAIQDFDARFSNFDKEFNLSSTGAQLDLAMQKIILNATPKDITEHESTFKAIIQYMSSATIAEAEKLFKQSPAEVQNLQKELHTDKYLETLDSLKTMGFDAEGIAKALQQEEVFNAQSDDFLNIDFESNPLEKFKEQICKQAEAFLENRCAVLENKKNIVQLLTNTYDLGAIQEIKGLSDDQCAEIVFRYSALLEAAKGNIPELTKIKAAFNAEIQKLGIGQPGRAEGTREREAAMTAKVVGRMAEAAGKDKDAFFTEQDKALYYGIVKGTRAEEQLLRTIPDAAMAYYKNNPAELLELWKTQNPQATQEELRYLAQFNNVLYPASNINKIKNQEALLIIQDSLLKILRENATATNKGIPQALASWIRNTLGGDPETIAPAALQKIRDKLVAISLHRP